MLCSMTGFARASHKVELSLNEKDSIFVQAVCELRALNSRYLDCIIKMPREYQQLENDIKRVISNSCQRGRVELTLAVIPIDSSLEAEASYSNLILYADHARFSRHLALAEELASKNKIVITDSFREKLAIDIISRKDFISEKAPSGVIVSSKDLLFVVEQAVEQLRESQLEEGKALKKDIIDRLHTVDSLVDKIQSIFSANVNEYFSLIKTRIKNLLSDSQIAEEKLLTEAALMVDRVDINEEITRLRSHINQFKVIAEQSRSGRKLDFLMQEFLREANTISSKVQKAEVQHISVELKAEIERIKEQIQNVE